MIYQVYHHPDQMRNLMHSVFTLENRIDSVTPYFENQIILEKFALNANDPYFGVVSHALKEKTTLKEADMQRILSLKKDGWILSKQSTRDPNDNSQFIRNSSKIHPHFAPLFDWLLESIGKSYDWRTVKKYPFEVHFNYIIIRSEIYADYIENYLRPSIEAMEKAPEEIREMLFANANYRGRFISEYRRREKFTRHMGIPHYPHHPFLLERLWMVYFSQMDAMKRLKLDIWTR